MPRKSEDLSKELLECRVAQNALRESEELFFKAFNANPGAISISRLVDGLIVDVNEAFLQLSGYTREEVIGHTSAELSLFTSPYERANLMHLLKQNGQVRNLEMTFLAKTNKPVKALISIDKISANSQDYIISTVIDITESKKSEDSLRESEERFVFALKNTPVIVGNLDLNLNFTWAYNLQSGYNPQDLIGKKFGTGVNFENIDYILACLKEVIAENRAKRLEIRGSGPFGEAVFDFYFEPRRTAKNEIIGVSFTALNIIERKKAERILQESKRMLEASQEIAHLGSWELDLSNNRLTWSDEAYKIFGLKPHEFCATYAAFLEAVHPDDRAAVDAAYSGSLRENKDTYDIEHRIVRKSTGEIRFVHEKCEHIRDLSGKIVASVGIVQDITERKKAEEEKVISEKRYRRLFETSQDGIIARDLKGRMIDCNLAYSKMVGYSKKELKELSPLDILPEKWRGHREKVVREVLESGGSVVFEREYQREDGVIFPASVRTWRLTDEKGNIIGTWSIVRDITQQKELQEKLQRYTVHLEQLVEERTKQLKDSERFAAIGATAGMVGHDIRNPLQAITNDLYLIKSELENLPENQRKLNAIESLNEIQENVDYINKIVADLQDYARPLSPRLQETKIKEIFNQTLANIGISSSIKTVVKVERGTEEIIADGDYLRRIITNLVLNAVQAMPKGGKLTIETSRGKQNGDVVLAVEDTGVGIPDDFKEKLFTPMFTTKSKGQGFGLAVVKRLTEALGGTVTFESWEGKGTTFFIHLPSTVK